MSVERELGFEAKGVARTQPARDNAELSAGFEHLIPHTHARAFVAGDVNFKAVFAGVPGACNQNIFQAANCAASDPIKSHCRKIGVGQLLENINASRALNRNLGKVIRKILHLAVELAGIVADPAEIFFAGAGIDDQKIFLFPEPVNDHVVNKRTLGI